MRVYGAQARRKREALIYPVQVQGTNLATRSKKPVGVRVIVSPLYCSIVNTTAIYAGIVTVTPPGAKVLTVQCRSAEAIVAALGRLRDHQASASNQQAIISTQSRSGSKTFLDA